MFNDGRSERLTPREWDVLRNLASGKTNAQIATGLFVTEGTVKSHVKHILRKLGATNRTEAVARYHRLISTAGANVG
jgi:DNA-binding NarL/FixJ family response regulator